MSNVIPFIARGEPGNLTVFEMDILASRLADPRDALRIVGEIRDLQTTLLCSVDAYRAGRMSELRALMQQICGAARRLDLKRLSQVSRMARRLALEDDGAALAAVMARLARLGEGGEMLASGRDRHG
ncbi:hypothetical protein [Profundibacterium mesophilum]|uniref:HPt domain-containing protein n=1 Tax=Profundibacterium mesophilum KAUST100406-0324 TaxID=1037889 RepID=A0A921NZP8_9RHOB|nr:hypothetical protein [Profundibacterium mesophilum]KAF0676508.1 hypothetical protein PMES_01240 [Profundibacterium mesophilum KAUST100406-0324]